jgi:1,2-diacylglycerol 3-beta-galactosyltransferase
MGAVTRYRNASRSVRTALVGRDGAGRGRSVAAIPASPERTTSPEGLTVLFLVSDTGGGHRRAAEAIMGELAAKYGPAFRPVTCDPLAGPAAAWPLRCLAALYGPIVRWAPWAWGVAYYISNSRLAMAVLWRTVFALADGPVASAVTATAPDVIVSCHPLTGRAAIRAARRRPLPGGPDSVTPVVTVVTDLVALHASWLSPVADLVAVPTAAGRSRCEAAGIPPARCLEVGLPVEAGGDRRVLSRDGRATLRQSLGLEPASFVVLLCGGGEGCGGLARRTAAILRQFDDVHVVTVCGRNVPLRRKLNARLGQARGQLTVLGFVGNISDWLRCADVVVTKAGPGIIAEAACVAVPLLLTSHLPGQERGNANLVVGAGAGRYARGVRGMLRELAQLREDPAALGALAVGSKALARPDAAADVAGLVGSLAVMRERASAVQAAR